MTFPFPTLYLKLALITLLFAAAGIQTYRLQGAQGHIKAFEERELAQKRDQARREVTNLRNQERTDEEYAAAQRRVAAVRVRIKPAPIIAATKPAPAASSNESAVCYDGGKLNAELDGWAERHAARLAAVIAGLTQRIDDRFSTVAAESEGIAAAYRACRAFALGVQAGAGGGGLAALVTVSPASPLADGRTSQEPDGPR